MKKTSSPFLPILSILILAGSVGGGYVYLNRDKFFPKPPEPPVEQPLIVHEQWKRENGSYVVTWEYPTSAGRTGKIGFKVKLNQDKIAGAEIVILTTNEESKAYQEDFQAQLAQTVVGKKLAEIANIDIIGGASSTTENFQEAVAALQTQLKI